MASPPARLLCPSSSSCAPLVVLGSSRSSPASSPSGFPPSLSASSGLLTSQQQVVIQGGAARANDAGLPPPNGRRLVALRQLLQRDSLSPPAASALVSERPLPEANVAFLARQAATLASASAAFGLKRKRFGLRGPRVLSAAKRLHERREQCLNKWSVMVRTMGPASGLYASTASSSFGDTHVRQVICRLAPATLEAYFEVWALWSGWASLNRICPCKPTQHALLDFFMHCSSGALRRRRKLSKSRVPASRFVSGLRFVARKAQLHDLLAALSSPCVDAYGSATSEADRREATPLPLAVVASWERELMSSQTKLPQRLLLGAWLAAVWGSLRFADVQRCSPASLTLEGHVLRGTCWSTKTTARGQPWGILACGATGERDSPAWAARWLSALQEWSAARQEAPDFLLPHCMIDVRGKACRVGHGPMNYGLALLLMRRSLLGCIGPSSSSYSLHSLKTTVLSWARQCCLSEENRAEQGHHRPPSGRQSVRLYSRDDVWGALRVQQTIVSRLREGWRPLTPLARGGLCPATEVPVSLPEVPPLPLHVPAIARADEEPVPAPLRPSFTALHVPSDVLDEGASPRQFDVYVINSVTGTCHGGILASDRVPARRRAYFKNQAYTAVCGALLGLAPEVRPAEPDSLHGTLRCMRRACSGLASK